MLATPPAGVAGGLGACLEGAPSSFWPGPRAVGVRDEPSYRRAVRPPPRRGARTTGPDAPRTGLRSGGCSPRTPTGCRLRCPTTSPRGWRPLAGAWPGGGWRRRGSGWGQWGGGVVAEVGAGGGGTRPECGGRAGGVHGKAEPTPTRPPPPTNPPPPPPPARPPEQQEEEQDEEPRGAASGRAHV